jgi:hypothetical protein
MQERRSDRFDVAKRHKEESGLHEWGNMEKDRVYTSYCKVKVMRFRNGQFKGSGVDKLLRECRSTFLKRQGEGNCKVNVAT